MADSPIFVFHSSSLVASCQFVVGRKAFADIVLPGAHVQIPPAVYGEVVTRGRARPDALKADELIADGYIQVADAISVSGVPEDLQHYQLGHGETEALALTTGLGSGAVIVTDDFLALIVANRLGLLCQLFLDFIVGRAVRGELPVTAAQQVVQAVSPRYPAGFVPHSLATLRRLQP